MHRADGASNSQNCDAQKRLVEFLEFLISGESAGFWRAYLQVEHERNIPLSEKVFIAFHNRMFPFNKTKEVCLPRLWGLGSALLQSAAASVRLR